MSEPESDLTFVWCPVANVIREPHPEGPDGEIRLGTRHFSAGTKVYVFPPAWGDGLRSLKVIGRHRGGADLKQMVVASKHLDEWRAKKVFHPFVVAAMADSWDDSDDSRARSEEMAKTMNERRTTTTTERQG